jgi:hypothetical protein
MFLTASLRSIQLHDMRYPRPRMWRSLTHLTIPLSSNLPLSYDRSKSRLNAFFDSIELLALRSFHWCSESVAAADPPLRQVFLSTAHLEYLKVEARISSFSPLSLTYMPSQEELGIMGRLTMDSDSVESVMCP